MPMVCEISACSAWRSSASDADLLMRRIDELFTARPFLGSRRMARILSEEGVTINRKRVQ